MLKGLSARRVSALALCCAMILTGCTGPRTMTDAMQEELLSRVEARWRALEANDFDTAYGFTSPAYRSVFSKSMYRHRFSTQIIRQLTDIEFLTYDTSAAVASVAVRVMSEPVKHTSRASAALGAIPSQLVEKWLFVDGQWWFGTDA